MGTGRLNAAALYGGAALVAAAGAGWWVAAAPATAEPDPRLAAWSATVAGALPSDDVRVAANGTAAIRSGGERTWDSDVSIGQFEIRMVCAGVGDLRVWVGAQGNGTAYTVVCGDVPVPQAAVVGAAGGLRVQASSSRGPAVFRWQLARIDY